MYIGEWDYMIQCLVDELDMNYKNELTLEYLSGKLGYSTFYTTRKFKELTGVTYRDYSRLRKLAFSLAELRNAERTILDVALEHGFSSHEAFTRAFKNAFGMTPSEYRLNPVPVELTKKIYTVDRKFYSLGGIIMSKLPGKPVFNCPIFEQVVRNALDKPEGEITSEEMAELTRLQADHDTLGITDITGIEYCVNLQSLQLYLNESQEKWNNSLFNGDLRPLSNLVQLTTLRLYNGGNDNIKDLSPLKKLTKMFMLNIAGAIEDISPLAGMTMLQSMQLRGSKLRDVRAVANTPRLSTLEFGVGEDFDYDSISALNKLDDLNLLSINESQVTDIGFLRGLAHLPRLSYLNLSSNQINDISPLAGFTNLKTLILNNNQIEDIGTLSNLVNLNTLYIKDNRIKDISPLRGLNKLYTLELNNNQIEDISALDGKIIANLKLDGNPIRDFSPAERMKDVKLPGAPVFKDKIIEQHIRAQLQKPEGEITGADMTGVNFLTFIKDSAEEDWIYDISGVEYCVNLVQLNMLNCCMISDLTPLAGLKRLNSMNLLRPLGQRNGIKDLSPLTGLTDMENLILRGGEIEDISPLRDMINLMSLDLSDNKIRDISPLRNMTKLTSLMIGANQVTDISLLENFRDLSFLTLSDNPISDYNVLRGLTGLRLLSISSDTLCDLSLLSGLTNLNSLVIKCKLLTDLSPLSGLTKLTSLSIQSDLLTDISVVSKMPDLTQLSVYGCPVVDFTPAAHVVSIFK